jgi:hypothetical protein
MIAGTTAAVMAAMMVASQPAAADSAPGEPSGPNSVAGLLAPSTGQALGFRVGISADATSAIASAVYTNNYSGTVKVYAKTGARWHQQVVWNDPQRHAKDFFGDGVATNGTTAVVGAPGTPYKGVTDAGWVYFYERSGQTWHLQSAWAGLGQNFLGFSVAISGNTAVVGEPGAVNVTGRAVIFVESGNRWQPRVTLIPGGVYRGALGVSVAISGNTVVVGDPFHYGHGIAYVFVRSRGTWRYDGPLHDPTPTLNDHFAEVVGVSGQIAVVGTGFKDSVAGAAFVYVRTASGWVRQATLRNPHAAIGDNFGWGVAISGTRVLVGAPVKGELKAPCGTAYEFVRVGRAWPERSEVADPGCSKNDFFGDSVALTGQSAIIGAPGTRGLAGAVYQLQVP